MLRSAPCLLAYNYATLRHKLLLIKNGAAQVCVWALRMRAHARACMQPLRPHAGRCTHTQSMLTSTGMHRTAILCPAQDLHQAMQCIMGGVFGGTRASLSLPLPAAGFLGR